MKKKVTAKVITISSQLFVSVLFILLSFNSGNNSNTEEVTVNNNNFDKMAKMTSILFEKENSSLDSLDESIISPLEEKKEEVVEEIKEEVKEEEKKEETPSSVPLDYEVIDTYVGTLTGYGSDCYGCSGLTSTGHNLMDSMYYEDSEFGTVRILAADKSFPFYSIFRVTGAPGMEPFIGIVLDRGGNVGFGKGTLFDLAFTYESDPNLIPLTRDVTFELLRSGK